MFKSTGKFTLLSALATTGSLLLAISNAQAEYKNLRFDENVAAYKDNTEVCPLKYITLNDSGTSILSIGGQGRVRYEGWDNFNFEDALDEDYFLFRARLHGDLLLGDNFRAFVEGISATATERDLPGGKRPIDEDTGDLLNAFFDVIFPTDSGTDTRVRVGRQELQLGKQRLISPLDWSNSRRTFEGFRVSSTCPTAGWKLDAFATRPVIVEQTGFNEGDENTGFHGLYATHTMEDLVYDLYWLLSDKDDLILPEVETSYDEERHTVGTRIESTCPMTGVEIEFEGGYQLGDSGRSDIEAYFFTAKFTSPEDLLPGNSRLALAYDIASGDSDPTDDKKETFDQLYPLGHLYFGYIDIIGRKNIHDLSLDLTVPAGTATQIKLAGHLFSRAENEDGLYNAGGALVRPGALSKAHEIGQEIDLLVKYALDGNTELSAGYSHFFAGEFVADTGSDDDIDFVCAAATYTF